VGTLNVWHVYEYPEFYAMYGSITFDQARSAGTAFTLFNTSLRRGGVVTSDWFFGCISPSSGNANIFLTRSPSTSDAPGFFAMVMK